MFKFQWWALTLIEYAIIAFAVIALCISFGFGVHAIFTWGWQMLQGLLGLLNQSQGLWLWFGLKLLLGLGAIIGLGIVLVYRVLPNFLRLLRLDHVLHWDELTSVETRYSRNIDGFVRSAVVATSAIATLICLPLLNLLIASLSLLWLYLGVAAGIVIGIAVIFMWRMSRPSDPIRTYYPRSKELYQLLMQNFGGEWSDDSDALLETIDKDSTDYQVALVMQASARGEIAHASFEYDHINLSNPEVHYGPQSDQDVRASNETLEELMNSPERVG
jgi:hypothetical protein